VREKCAWEREGRRRVLVEIYLLIFFFFLLLSSFLPRSKYLFD